MKSLNIDFYYFSGTGNTLCAVKAVKEKFDSLNIDKKITTKVFRLEKTDPSEVNLNHTIGIAFPAAYGFTYNFVWDFIKNLPQTNDTDVFLIVTMGGCSGACLTLTKKTLQKKGYNCLSALELIMPSNIASEKNRQKALKHYCKKKNFVRSESISENEITQFTFPDNVITDFVNRLINNNNIWKTKVFFSFIISLALKYLKPLRYLRKRYELNVNTSQCIQCGDCYKLCPADNVRMYEFPRFEKKCHYCLRCYALCPVKAISIKNLKIDHYKATSSEEILLEK